MAYEGKLNLCVLWEQEIRAAAKALEAYRLLSNDETATDEVKAAALVKALQTCHAAVYGAQEDSNCLVLSSVPQPAKRNRG